MTAQGSSRAPRARARGDRAGARGGRGGSHPPRTDAARARAADDAALADLAKPRRALEACRARRRSRPRRLPLKARRSSRASSPSSRRRGARPPPRAPKHRGDGGSARRDARARGGGRRRARGGRGRGRGRGRMRVACVRAARRARRARRRGLGRGQRDAARLKARTAAAAGTKEEAAAARRAFTDAGAAHSAAAMARAHASRPPRAVHGRGGRTAARDDAAAAGRCARSRRVRRCPRPARARRPRTAVAARSGRPRRSPRPADDRRERAGSPRPRATRARRPRPARGSPISWARRCAAGEALVSRGPRSNKRRRAPTSASARPHGRAATDAADTALAAARTIVEEFDRALPLAPPEAASASAADGLERARAEADALNARVADDDVPLRHKEEAETRIAGRPKRS